MFNFWIFKIIAKILLSQTPIPYDFFRKVNLFRHGNMDNYDYALAIFKKHYQNVKNIKNIKTILELGPGDSIVTALICYYFDIKCILLDNSFSSTKNIRIYKKIINKINFSKYKYDKLYQCKNIHEILKVCDSIYLTNGLSDLKQIENESVDFIFSNAVLEHVYKEELSNYIFHLKRILIVNFFMSHQIDLKDHLSNSLNHLRFSDKIWESEIFRTSGFYTNRYNFEEIYNFFTSNNMKVIKLKKNCWKNLPINKKNFSNQFRSVSTSTLLVNSFFILLQK